MDNDKHQKMIDIVLSCTTEEQINNVEQWSYKLFEQYKMSAHERFIIKHNISCVREIINNR